MAGRKPKGKPMSRTEMVEYARGKRNTSKLYKAEVKKLSDDGISKSIQKAVTVVNSSSITGRINLDDTDKVRSLVEAYLDTCRLESCIPSMTDISLILGYTRPGLYNYMKRNRGSDTGRFLLQVHDLIASILADNALRGNCNNIVSIFLLKSLYGFRENDSSIEANVNDSYEDEFYSGDDWQKKWVNLIGIDEQQ